jgi:hypothetical protein
VMKVGGVQHQTQFPAPTCQGAQESYRVCPAGQSHRQAKAGLQQLGVDGERRADRR